MNIVNDDGVMKYSLSDLETLTQRNAFFILREMEDANNRKLVYNDDYIEEESYIRFARWFNNNYNDVAPYTNAI